MRHACEILSLLNCVFPFHDAVTIVTATVANAAGDPSAIIPSTSGAFPCTEFSNINFLLFSLIYFFNFVLRKEKSG